MATDFIKRNEALGKNASVGVEAEVSKFTINIPFEIIKITCKTCGANHAVLGLTTGGDFFALQGYVGANMYCPYCGGKSC